MKDKQYQLSIVFDPKPKLWMSRWSEITQEPNVVCVWEGNYHELILSAYEEAVRWAILEGPEELCETVHLQ